MPAEMPDPLPQPNVLFKANRKRGYTGIEAIEEDEKDARRARRRAERDAEARRRENEARSQELFYPASRPSLRSKSWCFGV